MPSSIIQHSIKSELKGMLSLGTPLIFSQSIGAFSPFLSTAMVAHLGQDALAANVLVYSAYMALSILFIAFFNGVSVLVSHQQGAKNASAIRQIVSQAFLLSLLTSITLMLILFFAPYVLNWHTQTPHVIQLAHEYLHALLWTIPGWMLWMVIQQTLEGMGDTKCILVANVINVPLEILLIYGFIFGKFGLPACGIAGVGYGLTVSWTIAVIAMISYLATSKRYKKFHLFADIGKVHRIYLKELIRVGLPMGFMGFVEVSTFAILTLWMAKFGATALAAHQVLIQYLNFLIVFVFCVAQTVTIRVGHAVGRQDITGVYYATYVGVVLSFLCALALTSVFYFFPEMLLSLDMNVYDPAMSTLVQTAKQFLAILAVFYLIESVRLVIGYGALRGLKDVHFTMLSSLLTFWMMGLLFAFLFGFIFHFQGIGLWWGLTLGIALGAVSVIIRWYGLIKRIELAKLINVTGR